MVSFTKHISGGKQRHPGKAVGQKLLGNGAGTVEPTTD